MSAWNLAFGALGLFGFTLSGCMVADYIRNHIRGPWFEPVAMAIVSGIALFVAVVGRFQ